MSADPRWQLTQRVAESATFRRAPRLRTFLLFIIERTLRNCSSELKEYEIGVRVFGRQPDFDPAEDSLVRSSARVLRSKLQEYFVTEGKDEPLRIEVPKGSYVPEFIDRPTVAQGAAASEPPPAAAGHRRLVYALAAVCILLSIACLLLWKRRSPPMSPPARPPAPATLIFTAFDQPARELTLVYSDSVLTMVNSSRSALLSLDEYIQYKEDALPGAGGLGWLAQRRLVTSFRDTAFGQRLSEIAAREGRVVRPRHSRLMQARDFRSGDFILLGSPWSNPWVTLFEPHLTFHFEVDPRTGRYGIRNLHPRGGELPLYRSVGHRNGTSYALVSLLPNLSGNGRVLVLAGQHVEGSEGAEDAALSPGLLNEIRGFLGGRTLHAVTSLELLLEVNSVDGAARSTKVLAWRAR